MRIVKLSKKDPSFATPDGVRHFFLDEIQHRKPPGKFRVTAKKIKQDKLRSGEPLVFTYQSRVVFTARAASGLLRNDDEERQRYPNYFVVDLATLREADEDFYHVERQFNQATGSAKNLVRNQAWNPLPDSVHTQQVWQQLRKVEDFTLPDEIADPAGLPEGAVSAITVNAYERNPEARKRCIEHYGTNCSVCGFNFGSAYGAVAEGFIHIHHLRSLSEIGAEYIVDPIQDLRPVCPNCHAVLHRRIPPYSIEAVHAFLRRGGND